MTNRPLNLSVNGKSHELTVPDHRTLAEVLRHDLGLIATKETCGLGACGACSVLLDGEPIASCVALARYAEGREVTTLEGIAARGELHPLQKSFLEHNAYQCAFCTPGMIIMACGLLKENPKPSEAEIRDYMAGNICRCTTYHEIIRAIGDAHRFA
jgi:carbon-monoxide dehydrogenase small subunit